jgi:hypothetical protein
LDARIQRPTVLGNSHDVIMGGVEVPKGRYSVCMMVSQDSAWTMRLDPNWKQYHTDHPKPRPSVTTGRISPSTRRRARKMAG